MNELHINEDFGGLAIPPDNSPPVHFRDWNLIMENSSDDPKIYSFQC
jgi:hypothetical protein